MAELISMALTAADVKKFDEVPSPSKAPKFPFGLELHLDEKVLSKLGISTYMWNRNDVEHSYLLFKYKSRYVKVPIAYKVAVPFIEKYDRHKKQVFNEKRSYRFFWHIFKNCLLMGEIGMEIEQIFRDFLVIGKNEDGTPMTLGEKHDLALMQGNLKALPEVI